MSSAFFPLGMNNKFNQRSYMPWKGVNPSGSTSGTIRPLTNNDTTNNYPSGFGLPRPIKHARRGRDMSINQDESRLNKSSNTGNLVTQIMDTPGGFAVTEGGDGIKVVSSNFLNLDYLTEKPSTAIMNTVWPGPCLKNDANNVPSFSLCNTEKKARRRTMSASTIVKKNYYTRHEELRRANCKSFAQNEAQFKNYDNQYGVGQYDEVGCPCVVYKPNNKQFAQQGAVSCSTRMLKLNVETISTNTASLKNTAGTYLNVNDLNSGSNPALGFIYKNKSETCKSKCVT